MDRQTDSGKVNIQNLCPPCCHHPDQGVIIGLLPQPAPWGFSIDSCPAHFCPTHFPLYVQKDISNAYLINSLSCFKFSNGLPMPRRGESLFHKVPLGPSLLCSLVLFWAIQDIVFLQFPCCSFFLGSARMPVPSASLCSSCRSQVKQFLLEACLTHSPQSRLFLSTEYSHGLFAHLLFKMHHTGDYSFHICLSSVS